MDSRVRLGQSTLSTSHTLYIQIGSVCCALKCGDDKIYGFLKQLYHDFLTEYTTDITIESKVTDRLSPEDSDKALSVTLYTHEEGSRFRTTSQIVAGEYDLASRSISITAERSLNPAHPPVPEYLSGDKPRTSAGSQLSDAKYGKAISTYLVLLGT